MAKEIEAKFININSDSIISKLKDLGAILVYEHRLLRRKVYNLPTPTPGTWARVRDEVDKITMTYKCVNERSLNGVEEVEIEVNDFDKACDFLNSVGLIEKAYQETRRTRYIIKEDNVEFDIDIWPSLNPLIEIESDNEATVKKYADLLGFKWEDAYFGGADSIFAHEYNIDEDWINNQCPLLSFENIPPELQPSNKRIKM
jgi:adenylate cyclase class IV